MFATREELWAALTGKAGAEARAKEWGTLDGTWARELHQARTRRERRRADGIDGIEP